MTRDVAGSGSAPAGWLTPSARIERYVAELLDIGVSIPLEE